jgi:protein involved in polysaccharide export with SLBB domain
MAATNGDIPVADGDQIRVFSLGEFRTRRFVGINGAVKKGGQFPYRDGMTLRDLVMLAGGLQESALLTEAEIARLPESRAGGVMARTERVPLDSSYLFDRTATGRYIGPPGIPAPTSRAPEVTLLPYDNVLILRQPDWSLTRTVTVLGEVRYPGQYTLRTKSERLLDVILRAGGLTHDAYASGIVFTRDSVGRIGIDLPQVLRDSTHIDNLLLVNGDTIAIPRYSAVVRVVGSVNSPVGIAFVDGKNIDHYIRAAGGGTSKADLDRAYVTQPNGKVESRNRHFWFFKSTPHPQPGATVSVPAADPSERHDYAAIAAAVASILGSTVALAAVLKR